MSGGSMDYISYSLSNQVGCFRGDREEEKLEKILQDFVSLLHAREWYLSGDTGEGKWNAERDEFLSKYTENYVRPLYCKDCKYLSNFKDSENYGKCEFINGCLSHKFDDVCEKFEVK